MTRQALEIDLDRGREKYIERVLRNLSFKAMPYLYDLVGAFDEALGEEKPCRQLTIVSWRTHGYGDTAPPYADFQWLFPCKDVGASFRFATEVVA